MPLPSMCFGGTVDDCTSFVKRYYRGFKSHSKLVSCITICVCEVGRNVGSNPI